MREASVRRKLLLQKVERKGGPEPGPLDMAGSTVQEAQPASVLPR